ncbi:Hypothetical protein R9X50_00426000 [Acrodontium crateriforme]|uniref:C2 domain-containing protein n=1 Tax=Acrodontium crateriforme TaxID=150365 RepID=A0AAQ3M5U5_9PEZI|nr:Hypothetical protein R9X50_00426000 [Acrodontium crateriforme]
MASKQAMFSGPHAAGIFADMSVDGPEIGTLVLIFDRAKNLPNRKSMGKQNPYCAARLGKEAKKTDVDKRGGQTPRWDQEIRFTIHDSADYYNLKISVFSEDKKTDLIGEAWIKLDDVVIPGGGKMDVWQGLNYKGKYAGELRLEMTYYDTRSKPEKLRESVSSAAPVEDLKQSVRGPAKVKRRPLPTNPNNSHESGLSEFPDPYAVVRTKHGPRELKPASRANSMPPEAPYNASFTGVQQQQQPQQQQQQQPQYPQQQHQLQQHPPPPQHSQEQLQMQQHQQRQYQQQELHMQPQQQYAPTEQSQPNNNYADLEQYHQYPVPGAYRRAYDDPFQMPDFLPQLPPSNRQRNSQPPRSRQPSRQVPVSTMPERVQHPHTLPHSHSAPSIHSAPPGIETFEHAQQMRTDYPKPIADLDFQHSQIPANRNQHSPSWQEEYQDPYVQQQQPLQLQYAQVEDEEEAPPPPPMHSKSAPAVPQYSSSPHGHMPISPPSHYGNTPPSARQQPLSHVSPLQSIERTLAQPQGTPVHTRPSPGGHPDGYQSSPDLATYNSPPNQSVNQTPSPMSRAAVSRAMPQRQSVVDPYNTPPRPHPLSQQVTRGRSPHPYTEQQLTSPPDQYAHDAPPLIKPRALSPRPPPQEVTPSSARPRSSRSSYDIQFPVRSFESSDNNPLSTSAQPSPRNGQAASQVGTMRKSVSPRPSLAATSNSGSGVPFGPDSFDVHNPNARESTISHNASPRSPWQVSADSENAPERKGPIVGWHGQEIDPSDHLPVEAWAPEPEKKTPTKTYGLGRDRDFGPRSAQNSGGRVSRDMLVNVRMKVDATPQPKATQNEPSPSPTRNRLVKKNSPFARNPVATEPLRERENYNAIPSPYAQGQEYSRGFHDGSPGNSPYPPNSPYTNSAPNLPPKIPLQAHDYGPDALSREISSIDIGPGNAPLRHSRQQSVPAPNAYVPSPPRGALMQQPHHRNSYY